MTGNEFRQWRLRNQLTTPKCASLFGIASRKTIEMWEKGINARGNVAVVPKSVVIACHYLDGQPDTIETFINRS